jgi:hypothetical protein
VVWGYADAAAGLASGIALATASEPGHTENPLSAVPENQNKTMADFFGFRRTAIS